MTKSLAQNLLDPNSGKTSLFWRLSRDNPTLHLSVDPDTQAELTVTLSQENTQRIHAMTVTTSSVAVNIPLNGHDVPVPHFGVVLTMPQWEALAARLQAAGVRFGIEPYVRFKGQVGEQATLFFTDPSGNALEFKAFADDGQLFAT